MQLLRSTIIAMAEHSLASTEAELSQAKPTFVEPLREFRNWLTQKDDVDVKDWQMVEQKADQYAGEILKTGGPEEFHSLLSLLHELNDKNIVIKNLDHIVNRFVSFMSENQSKSYQQSFLYHDIGQEFRVVLWQLARAQRNPEIPEERAQIDVIARNVDRLYGLIDNESKHVRHHVIEAMEDVIVLDNQNRQVGLSHDIYNRFCRDLIEKAVCPSKPYDTETALHMVDAAWAGGFVGNVLVPAVRAVHDENSARTVMNLLGNRLSAEMCVKMLEEAGSNDEEFRKQANQFLRWVHLIPEHAEQVNTVEFYKPLDMSNWKALEGLTNKEIAMVMKYAGDKKIFLDTAAGTGRHFLKLKEAGKHVIGIDLMKEYLLKIKEKDQNAEVYVASWHHLPVRKESVEVVYCFGRSFPHNATAEDVVMALNEMYKALTPDGVAMIDSASASMGAIADRREEFDEALNNARVGYAQPDVVMGTTDGKHYTLRWFPKTDVFEHLALAAGFELRAVEQQEYKDHEGKNNINYYYILKKKVPPPDVWERAQAMGEAKQSGPPLYVTWL